MQRIQRHGFMQAVTAQYLLILFALKIMPQFEERIQQYEDAMRVTVEVQILARITRNILVKEEVCSMPILFRCESHCPVAAIPVTAKCLTRNP